MGMTRLRGKIFQTIQWWAAPLLLLTVAGRQILLVNTVGLSPWHGGGFGMFASIDRDERRLIKLDAIACQGQQISQVLTPETTGLTDSAWTHLTTVPRASQLSALGDQLLADKKFPNSPIASPESNCLQKIQLQVWRLHYSQASGQMWYAPVTSAVEVTR